jgi:hypothetical protein
MWSPQTIRTSNATQTNITSLLKYNHELFGPNLNQQQQGLSTTSGKENSHLFSAQLRWGPYKPVYENLCLPLRLAPELVSTA